MMVSSGKFNTVFGAYALLRKITFSIFEIITWFGELKTLISLLYLKDFVLKKIVIFSYPNFN